MGCDEMGVWGLLIRREGSDEWYGPDPAQSACNPFVEVWTWQIVDPIEPGIAGTMTITITA